MISSKCSDEKRIRRVARVSPRLEMSASASFASRSGGKGILEVTASRPSSRLGMKGRPAIGRLFSFDEDRAMRPSLMVDAPPKSSASGTDFAGAVALFSQPLSSSTLARASAKRRKLADPRLVIGQDSLYAGGRDVDIAEDGVGLGRTATLSASAAVASGAPDWPLAAR